MALDLEVLVAMTPADGKTPLKWLLVNLPANVERTMTHLSADYVGATATVLDAEPVPAHLPGAGRLRRPAAAVRGRSVLVGARARVVTVLVVLVVLERSHTALDESLKLRRVVPRGDGFLAAQRLLRHGP